MERIKRFGLIVNPIAGMGGKTALKGTDGKQTLAAAIARGAHPESEKKAERAMQLLLPFQDRILIYTASGPMGEDLCRRLGLPFRVVYTCSTPTTAEDTVHAASVISEAGISLLLFAGGDGTARNIYQSVKDSVPVLGIPSGVKIQSAVFALDPESAGAVAARMAQNVPMTGAYREVVDLDEDAYRTGTVSAALYGVMAVPDQPEYLQSMKQSGFSTEQNQLTGISAYLEDHLEKQCLYAVGPGSTAKCLSRRLGLDFELLGVDIIQDGRLLDRDVTEEQLWQYTRMESMKIIVSPIGGQGFLFGRGNHQFSSRVLSAVGKDGIIVISPESKLLSIKDHTLHIDCDAPHIGAELKGYYNVLCGYGIYHSMLCK